MSTRNSALHNYEYIAACSHIPTLPSRFSLTIRQQPGQARISATNERDRRPVDPPPILQIKLEDATSRETQDFLQNPYFFMGASLLRLDKLDPYTSGLAGQTVSSMYKLKDYDNNDGGFFVFGDLSVRIEGQYRLRFTLFEITTQGVISLKSIISDIFTVYSAKTFPGMLESTFLSRSFSDQGVRLRIRKEHRVQMSGSRKRKMSSVPDDNDTVSSGNSSVGKIQRSPYHSPPTSVSWYWGPPPPTPPQPPMCFDPRPPNPLYYQYSPTSATKATRRYSTDTPLPPLQTTSRRSWSFSVHRSTTPPFDNWRRMSEIDNRRRTLEQDDEFVTTPSSVNEGGIRLPPIRNIIGGNKDIGEVDAAVAMMQLASSQQSPRSGTPATAPMVIHPPPPSRRMQTDRSTVW